MPSRAPRRATPTTPQEPTWPPPVIAGDCRFHQPRPRYAPADQTGGTGARNRSVNGLRFQPGAAAVACRSGDAAGVDPDVETDQTSFNVPATRRVSTIANAAHAAPIATAW